jgi:multidrug efflux system membrane fusion protein
MKFYPHHLSLLLVSLPLVGGCNRHDSAPPQERVVAVRAVVAAQRTVPLYVDSIGTCTACEKVDVHSQVSGQILSEHFHQGQMVEKGQVLYRIDPRLYEAQVRLARGQLQQAEAKLAVDQAKWERSQPLLAGQYISQQDYDLLGALVDQDRGLLESAKGQLQQAETQLDFCTITAPVRGLVGYKLTNVGNVVHPGGGPLLTVQTPDPLFVDFPISENEFPVLWEYFSQQRALDCVVQLMANPKISSHANLEIINNEVSRQSGNVKLRAILANGDGIFWPGEAVRVRVILTQLEKAILIPESAVGTGNHGDYVFVVSPESRAEVRPVKVGQLHGTDVVILAGMEAGARVVTDGQFLLAPKTRVTTAEDGTNPEARNR